MSASPPSDRPVHELPLIAAAADIDELGHVNNIVYLRWVQEAAVAHWRALAPADAQAGLAWVVLRHEIDYSRAAMLGDELLARTWVGAAEGLSFERHTEIVRRRDARMLARARTLWCPVDMVSGRPRRVGEDVRRLFSSMDGTTETGRRRPGYQRVGAQPAHTTAQEQAMNRTADARWEGDLKGGKGSMRLGSGAFEGEYSFGTRFEGAPGTNPEELLGAAHAGCFSMALSLGLTQAGTPPKSIETRATVHLEKVGEAMSITGIDLVTKGDVPGVSAADFQRYAEDARKNCIVSRALSVPMTLQATLAGA